MSSLSKFVIGSDDEQMDQDLDSKQAYDDILEHNADSNKSGNSLINGTEKANNKNKKTIISSYETVTDEFKYDEYRPLIDIIDTSEFYPFQNISHKIVYPLIWLCDHKLIRSRSWLQIPLIKYMICITSMIIGIALSQLIIKGYELKAADILNQTDDDHYDLNDVIYFLSAYVVLITILCICFLYKYYQYNIQNNYLSFSFYHYNYFVMTCSGIIGYGILYLLVHIQSEFYSSSIHSAFECLTTSSIFAISFVGIIVFIKQFMFDFNFRYNLIEDEYETDEDNENNPLLNDDDSAYYQDNTSLNDNMALIDNGEFMIDNHLNDDERTLNEYKEKGILWFTISILSMDIWHIAIGLIMIECVVYIFKGQYINLLMDWTHDQSTIIGNNIWNVVVFGFILAFITGIAQIAMQIYCKSPLYQYQLELTAMNEYNNYNSLNNTNNNNMILSYLSTLPHKEDIILFLLNWLNDISYLWNKILSAAIGWSLLTPNQTNNTLKQLITALTATFLFLFIGFIFNDYKRRIQKDILLEIRDIKKQLKSNDNNNYCDDEELMRIIVYDKQKLIFYDQLHATYDLAFAVSVSYSWQSFINIALSNCLGINVLNRFITHLILTIFIIFIFSQFGLELVDLKKQRLKEAKLRKQNRKNNKANNDNIQLQISGKRGKRTSNKKKKKKTSLLLTDP